MYNLIIQQNGNLEHILIPIPSFVSLGKVLFFFMNIFYYENYPYNLAIDFVERFGRLNEQQYIESI